MDWPTSRWNGLVGAKGDWHHWGRKVALQARSARNRDSLGEVERPTCMVGLWGCNHEVRLARAQIKFIRVNSKAVLQYDSATVRRLRTDIDVARACEVHQGAGRCTKL